MIRFFVCAVKPAVVLQCNIFRIYRSRFLLGDLMTGMQSVILG